MTKRSQQAWERAAEWPLAVAALLFLGAYAWPVLDPDLGGGWRHLCGVVDIAVWVLFAADYLARFWLAENKLVFVRSSILDLIAVALPVLRPLRLLRLLRVLTVLNHVIGGSLRGRVAVYVVAAAGLIIFVASLAVLEAERDKNPRIDSFGEALWWSFTALSRSGGDESPVTATGRFIAVGLALVGLALLAVVTATLASWLIERISEVEEELQAATRRDVRTLRSELLDLHRKVDGRLNGSTEPRAMAEDDAT